MMPTLNNILFIWNLSHPQFKFLLLNYQIKKKKKKKKSRKKIYIFIICTATTTAIQTNKSWLTVTGGFESVLLAP